MHAIPSRVLKALRAMPEVDPALQRRVEEFVENDDTLVFVAGDPQRSIALVLLSAESGAGATLARAVRTDPDCVELERCLEIRREVFIEEQQISKELELDDLDADCTHFLAWKGSDREASKAVGTARLRINSAGVAKAQRVAVLAAARGKGIGRILMRAVEAETRLRGIDSLILGAQQAAIPFYQSIGYQAYGDEFDDAGISHRMMRRRLG